MPLIGGEDKIYWLRKWNNFEQEEESILHEYQETFMGDIMKLQAKIVRDDRDEEIHDSVGTICGGIRMENHISRKSDSLDLQDK